MLTLFFRIRTLATLTILSLLGACASLPDDLGRSEVVALVEARGVTMPESADESETVLETKSLTPGQAVRYALANNRELTMLYYELGFAVAGLYDANRIRNPVFSAALLDSDQSGLGNQLTLGIVAPFADIVTMPARKRMANAQFAAARQEFAFAVLGLASETQAAYYKYVAARQVLMLREQTAKTATLSRDLAERYFSAGNIALKDFALHKAAAAEAELVELKARAQSYEARTHLARLLGVTVADPWETRSTLPLPPSQRDSIGQLINLALESRLDLSAAKIRADYLADQLGVTNWNRWLGDLSLGYERDREADGAVLKGPVLEWELPLFSFRRGELIRAETELQIQAAALKALSLDIENDVRLAFEQMNNSEQQLLTYKDRLIPARIDATARAQEEENFMLIGIFELIETKQAEFDSYEGYIEAVGNYWLARTELARSIGNQLPSDSSSPEGWINTEQFQAPESGKVDHSKHQMRMPDEPSRETGHNHH